MREIKVWGNMLPNLATNCNGCDSLKTISKSHKRNMISKNAYSRF